MPLISRCIFHVVRWAARKGLRDDHDDAPNQRKHESRRAGIRGEITLTGISAATATFSLRATSCRAAPKVKSI